MSVCKSCKREAPGDGRFCKWCGAFQLTEGVYLAGLFPRFIATIVDFIVGWAVVILAFVMLASGSAFFALLGLVALIAVPVGWFMLWRRGLTPGKSMMKIRVSKTDGSQPGIGTMLLREWIGKYIDGLIFGLGWLWAIFDRDRQAWHDKVAGTVVVRAR